MAIQVNPNRMELLKLRKKQAVARRGHKLLKDKLEGLLRDFMRIVRAQTSKLTFDYHPVFHQDNYSRDFWAPGYLVIISTHFHTPDMVQEFIRTTRQHQGILLHRRRS